MKTSLIKSICAVMAIGMLSHPAHASRDVAPNLESRCRAFVDDGRFNDCIALADSTSKSPTPGGTVELQILKTRALAEQGRLDQALAELGTLQQLVGSEASRHRGETLNLAGAIYLATGSFAEADLALRDAVGVAQTTKDSRLLAKALHNRAIVKLQQNDPRQALALIEKGLAAAEGAGAIDCAARLYISYANALLDMGDNDSAAGRMAIAHQKHLALAPSQSCAKGLAAIGDWYLQLAATVPRNEAGILLDRAGLAYADALEAARQQDDPWISSYASGNLGRAYELKGQHADALRLTRSAMFHAQQGPDASQLLYLWQWQCARILRAQGGQDQAISMNRMAVQTLQANKALFTSSQSWDFETDIKPVYLDLAEMLLSRASTLTEPQDIQANLREVLQTVELLRSDELKDYLRESCLPSGRAPAYSQGTAGKGIALVHYLVLGERIEVLVETASGISRSTVAAAVSEVSDQAWLFRRLIEDRDQNYLQVSRKLHDLLISPLQPAIAGSSLLVIVPDGVVRTIPMAALHDGTSFLVERHALELAQVDASAGLSSGSGYHNLLLGGISGKVPGYRQIPFVDQELRDIHGIYGGAVLQNQSFTASSLMERMKADPYQVLHIASHGIFTGEVSGSYILAWGGKLRMDQLGSIARLRRHSKAPLDLLVLSACSAAAGDERAPLGLAGVAVKAGARSAIAALWDVDDQATARFFSSLYRIMKEHPSLSKAEALRQAQLQMLRGTGRGRAVLAGDGTEQGETMEPSAAPYYWAPFVLVTGSI
jgi:CHAT domain-containing protein